MPAKDKTRPPPEEPKVQTPKQVTVDQTLLVNAAKTLSNLRDTIPAKCDRKAVDGIIAALDASAAS